MSERLAFLTDVLRARLGAEQRRSLRETPRRTFEGDFLLVGPERTFWDLFMNRLAGQEVMIPLYWEAVGLPAGTIALSTDRINFSTVRREWPNFTGGLALISGDTALDYEVVEIAGVDDNGIDLAAPVSRAWRAGTKLYPLRRGVIDDAGELDHASAAVGTVTAQFRLNVANPWTPATSDPAPVYGGLPVLIAEPNWIETLSVDMSRQIATLDTEVGLTYQTDVLGRFLAGQAHRWWMPGREALAIFRDLLYRHRGRAGAFWLPTFKADFRLAAATTSGSNQVTVDNVGFGYTGGPTSGREYVMIRHTSGVIFRKIVDVIPGTTSATEKLVLDSPVGLALQPGQVRKISFMDTARFDADEFEITHHAGIDGLHECSTTYRAFKNTRTSPTPISYPIPTQNKNAGPCGSPFTLVNPSFEEGTTGWSGSIAARTVTADGGPPYDGIYVGWPGNNAESEFYQDLPIPNIWIARVDANKVKVSGFSAYHQTYSAQTDHGQMFVSFRNAGNVEISRVSTPMDYSKSWVLLQVPDTMVPVGTRIIRFGTHNVRDEGSENNNDWDLFLPGLLIEV